MVTAYTNPFAPRHNIAKRSGGVTGVTICTSAKPSSIERPLQVAAFLERQVRNDESGDTRLPPRRAAGRPSRS